MRGAQKIGGGNHSNDVILTFMVQPMYIDELHEAMLRGEENVGTQE